MTPAHLDAVRLAILNASERNDLEDVKYLQDVADLVKSHITVEIPSGKYTWDEFKKKASEKLP